MPNGFYGQMGGQQISGQQLGGYSGECIPATAAGPGTMMTSFGAFHCPACGYSGPTWHYGASPASTWGWGYGTSPGMGMGTGMGAGVGPAGPGFGAGWGLGGLRRWGGSYSPQYVSTGLPTDEEITEMIYDALDADPFVPYDAEIEVSADAGVVTISGTVPNKRIKHSAGDNAWWVPGVVDVHNELQVSGRRRSRNAPSEAEGQQPSGRRARTAR